MKSLYVSTALLAATLLTSPAGAVIAVGSDPILYWNTVALANLPGGPPAQARAAAMVNIAMYDAVNAALGRPNVGYTGGVSATGGDVRAAASQAAYGVLMSLNATPPRKRTSPMRSTAAWRLAIPPPVPPGSPPERPTPARSSPAAPPTGRPTSRLIRRAPTRANGVRYLARLPRRCPIGARSLRSFCRQAVRFTPGPRQRWTAPLMPRLTMR